MTWVVSLVEDDDDIREHLADVLKARGLRVVEARHGAEVLDLIRRQGIRPSLLVLDLMMPVMDGWAVLNAQAAEPLLDGVPIIVITASDKKAPFPATVQAVFHKPFALGTFLDTVRRVCADMEAPRRPARGSDGLREPLKPPTSGDDDENEG